MKTQTLPLFASYLTAIDLDYNPQELKNQPIKFQSTHGRSENSLISCDLRVLEKYPKTKKVLLDAFKTVAQNLDYDNDFKITTSWFTAAESNQKSHQHSHKNSFYSGIYYFDKYTDNCGILKIISPVLQLSDFNIIPLHTTIKNCGNWEITPRHNLVVFFPSYLQHYIDNHNDDMTRYSLAFNIVPTGEYGFADSAYNTSWFK